MFRKDPEIAKNWCNTAVNTMPSFNGEILPHAARMVAPAGCSCIQPVHIRRWRMSRAFSGFGGTPEFHLVELPIAHGIMPGHPEWAESPGSGA